MDCSRFYQNPYGNISSNGNSVLSGKQLKGDLIGKLRDLNEVLSRKLENVIQNIPQNSDHTVYTGYSGIAYLYLLKYKRTRNQNYLRIAKELIDKAISRLKGHDISFLLGDAGPLALGAILYSEMQLKEESDVLIRRLLDLPAIVRDPPYEILYGHAGYLYALLLINKEIGPIIPSEAIKKTIRIILDDGKNKARNNKFPAPLLYEWYDSNYLGAAHGVSGILYMLLSANDYLTKSDREELIKPTIDWLSQNRFPSGNFKANEGRDRDALVHWCHGSPGVVYLYLLASKIFNNPDYLVIAQQCGDVVWIRGLLQKGYSICHGVSGNAYTFIHLYQETGDVNHLYRAACFADWCTRYPEAEGHKPDSPFSLFEGIAGLDYFLVDIEDIPNASFPAFTLS